MAVHRIGILYGRVQRKVVYEFDLICVCGNAIVVGQAGDFATVREAEQDFMERHEEHGWKKFRRDWLCPSCTVEREDGKR